MSGMSTSAQDIIDAIDAAILANAAGPWEISLPVGGTVRYHELDKLLATRTYYANQLSSTGNNPAARLRITRFNSGGTV